MEANTKVIYIIKREAQEQTKETVDVLPIEVKEHVAEYILTIAEFIHCINVANGTTVMNIAGEYAVSQEFREMAEDVMDCITSGEYIITADEQEANNLLTPTNIIDRLNHKGCYYARPNGEDCSMWECSKINKQLDFCEQYCSRYNQCSNVAVLLDESQKKLDDILKGE